MSHAASIGADDFALRVGNDNDPAGWSIGATVGRIYRLDSPAQFGADTGLSGTSSDWLAAVQYNLADSFSITSRLRWTVRYQSVGRT